MAVTGASGFIGRHVVAEAQGRGHEVVAMAGPQHGGNGAIGVDLRTGAGLPAILRGADVVIHCAAALGGDAATQQAITVGGTRTLLSAMADAGVRDIVLIGSFAVYNHSSPAVHGRLDEDTPLEAHLDRRAPYIRAKLEQEALVRGAPGLSWTIVRPGIVFGPGRTWFHHLGAQLPGGFWLCLAPDSPLPLTHVQNCAEAIVLAAENHDARGCVLNLVDDELPHRGEYVRELAAGQRQRPKTLRVSWASLTTMAKAASLAGPRAPDLLNRASLDARCKPLHYTNERAKAVLGWTPRVDWRSGLRQALEAEA